MPKPKKPAGDPPLSETIATAPKEPAKPVEGLTPWSVLQAAVKAVPALKYALGVLGIVSSIAIIKVFGIDYRVAAFGTVVMVVLMVALVVFAALTKVNSPQLRIAALVMMWSFLVITILSAALLFTSAFFNCPRPLAQLLGLESTLNGTQEKEGTEPSELVLTDLTDDPPPVENMGSEIDKTVMRAERQLFGMQHEPSSDSSPADAPVIRIADQFDGHLLNKNTKKGSRGKAIKFILSNPGDGVLFVDKIWLTILDCGELALYSFPVGVRIPSQPIQLEVTLNSKETDYPLTEKHFSLSKGNPPDEFWVQLKSSEAFWYRVKVNARWFKVGATHKKGVAATRDYLVGFPQVRDFRGLLADAKKLDIQINTGGLRDLQATPTFKDDSTRILFPGAS